MTVALLSLGVAGVALTALLIFRGLLAMASELMAGIGFWEGM